MRAEACAPDHHRSRLSRSTSLAARIPLKLRNREGPSDPVALVFWINGEKHDLAHAVFRMYRRYANPSSTGPLLDGKPNAILSVSRKASMSERCLARQP